MVRVQIPVDTPIDDEDDKAPRRGGKRDGAEGGGAQEDEELVGIMSDIEESDVDDDIADPDWEEVEGGGGGGGGLRVGAADDDDDFSFRPGRMPSLPENGVTISLSRPKRGQSKSKSKAKKKKKKNAKKQKGGKEGSDKDGDSDSGSGSGSGSESESESEGEEIVARKKKRCMDVNEMVRRNINRLKITEQLMRHKLSLLLYLARGLRLVKIVNCNVVKGLSLSVVDNNMKFSSARLSNRKFLEKFMARFNDTIGISDDEGKRTKHMQQPFMLNMLDCYASLETTSLIELVVMFVACLRATKPDLPTRIVNVLRPISLHANIIPKPAEGEPLREPEPQAPEEIIEKLDYWVEVYLVDEKKWCCLDLCNAKLDEPNVLTELSRPFKYLVSYDVDRYCVKAAEKNYCENWYTPAFRKGRCEDKWWDGVMEALGPAKRGDKDTADEIKTDQMLTKQEMPTSDTGFRRHPLYVLEKHLLKFEAIYPPEVPPLGYFKEQPVYPRDCVHTLRSRETWLREARTVRLHETAYKVVNARPKYDKFTGELQRDLMLDLFGEWQTQAYEPPAAQDGKVPRNCYGNVDMYKPCMLPRGCVWLKLPGLQRVANKLKIDCAPAVVGFDNHCSGYGAFPVTDGFIVCEEFAETLQAAWDEEQVNAARREQEKREKRIWDNWKRLLKAAIIRERLRVKYKNS